MYRMNRVTIILLVSLLVFFSSAHTNHHHHHHHTNAKPEETKSEAADSKLEEVTNKKVMTQRGASKLTPVVEAAILDKAVKEIQQQMQKQPADAQPSVAKAAEQSEQPEKLAKAEVVINIKESPVVPNSNAASLAKKVAEIKSPESDLKEAANFMGEKNANDKASKQT